TKLQVSNRHHSPAITASPSNCSRVYKLVVSTAAPENRPRFKTTSPAATRRVQRPCAHQDEASRKAGHVLPLLAVATVVMSLSPNESSYGSCSERSPGLS